MDEELEKRAALVSQAIERLMPIVHPQGLYQASRHLVDSGGKRLRPSMLLLAAEAAGGSPEGWCRQRYPSSWCTTSLSSMTTSWTMPT